MSGSYNYIAARYEKLTARQLAGEWVDAELESDEEGASGAEMARRLKELTDDQDMLNKGRAYLTEVARKMLTKSEIPDGFAELVGTVQALSEFLNDDYGRGS